jgi:hypothetical protein
LPAEQYFASPWLTKGMGVSSEVQAIVNL